MTLISAMVVAARADDSTPAATTQVGNVGSNPATGAGNGFTNSTGIGELAVGSDIADLLGKKPRSYAVGPFDLTPMLEVIEAYNDNMFFNNLNRKGSMLTQVRLGLQLELDQGPNHYDLQYGFRSWTWHSSPTDDYLDQFVAAKAHVEFTSRNRLDFKASYIDSHNLRGTYFTAPGLPYSQLPSPLTFYEYNAEAKYRYGAIGAQGNLELITGFSDLNYNPITGANTSTYDKTRIYVVPGFYYRLEPKTHLLAQVEATWYQYHDSTSAQLYDFNLQRYLIGVQWEATAKTSGTLRMGYMTQQFNNGQSGASGFTGDIGLVWSPLSYSRFNLSASRNIQPTIGYGTSFIANMVSASWMHDWNSQLSSHLRLGYTYMNNQNVATAGVNSNQVTNEYINVNVGVDYAVRDWLSVGLNYTFNNLSSSYNVQNYDQNIVMLYFTFNPHAQAQTSAPWNFNF